uniref:Signal recognition particle 14 kDa protein n=1 Tax=Equus caballus TaxID=9796 RepID=A0A9L0T5J2_HORSE
CPLRIPSPLPDFSCTCQRRLCLCSPGCVFPADDGRTKPIPRKGSVEGFEPSDNKCLLRATDGKKKISTVVSSKEVNKFQMAYSNLLRANMDGLKKRDKKSKSKKSKAAQ